jgi:hypothetical protein
LIVAGWRRKQQKTRPTKGQVVIAFSFYKSNIIRDNISLSPFWNVAYYNLVIVIGGKRCISQGMYQLSIANSIV